MADGEGNLEWRVVYRVDVHAIIVVAVLKKKTQAMPQHWIETCQERLRRYDAEEE